jgi:DnaK suppressor protein
MDVNELDGCKLQLLELQKRLVREVDMAEEAMREDVVAPGAVSTIPTHPADQAAEGLDVEIAVAQNEELLLVEVEAALERIEAGTYGACAQCGRPIGTERLQALPYTPRCIDCARGHHDEIEELVPGEPRRI